MPPSKSSSQLDQEIAARAQALVIDNKRRLPSDEDEDD